jgi:hypothetical protein
MVPYRYSPVTSMMPARAANTPAKLPTASADCWSSVVSRPRSSVARPVSSEKRTIRATIPRTRPSVVRVERIFSSSALSWLVMPPAPR